MVSCSLRFVISQSLGPVWPVGSPVGSPVTA